MELKMESIKKLIKKEKDVIKGKENLEYIDKKIKEIKNKVSNNCNCNDDSTECNDILVELCKFIKEKCYDIDIENYPHIKRDLVHFEILDNCYNATLSITYEEIENYKEYLDNGVFIVNIIKYKKIKNIYADNIEYYKKRIIRDIYNINKNIIKLSLEIWKEKMINVHIELIYDPSRNFYKNLISDLSLNTFQDLQ